MNPLQLENFELREKLAEAEETLRAIQNGEVDAIVANTDQGAQIFTLSGADRPYRILVEKMNEGAATLSQNGTILYANECLARMFQTQFETWIGTSMSHFIEPEKKKNFELFFEKGKVDASRSEFQLITKNSLIIPAYLSISAVQIDGTKGACLLATDLSEQRASLMKDEFLAMLSHELRTPLTAILSWAQLFRIGKLDAEKMRRGYEIVEQSAMAQSQLADDLLDISRIQAGKLSLTTSQSAQI